MSPAVAPSEVWPLPGVTLNAGSMNQPIRGLGHTIKSRAKLMLAVPAVPFIGWEKEGPAPTISSTVGDRVNGFLSS